MSEKYTPADGEPVDMSKVTLGPRYGSEDMYRDMGIGRGDLVSFEKDGVIYTDYVGAVRRDPLKRAMAVFADIEKTLAGLGLEPWAPLTWRQRIWRRIRQIIRR